MVEPFPNTKPCPFRPPAKVAENQCPDWIRPTLEINVDTLVYASSLNMLLQTDRKINYLTIND